MHNLNYSERKFATCVYVVADIVINDNDGRYETWSYIPGKGYTTLEIAKHKAQEEWRYKNFDKGEGLEFKWRDDLGHEILSYSYLKERTSPEKGYISATGLVIVTHSRTEMVRTEDVDICCILEIPILSAKITETEELT